MQVPRPDRQQEARDAERAEQLRHPEDEPVERGTTGPLQRHGAHQYQRRQQPVDADQVCGQR
jgi:hypothetical protein